MRRAGPLCTSFVQRRLNNSYDSNFLPSFALFPSNTSSLHYHQWTSLLPSFEVVFSFPIISVTSFVVANSIWVVCFAYWFVVLTFWILWIATEVEDSWSSFQDAPKMGWVESEGGIFWTNSREMVIDFLCWRSWFFQTAISSVDGWFDCSILMSFRWEAEANPHWSLGWVFFFLDCRGVGAFSFQVSETLVSIAGSVDLLFEFGVWVWLLSWEDVIWADSGWCRLWWLLFLDESLLEYDDLSLAWCLFDGLLLSQVR